MGQNKRKLGAKRERILEGQQIKAAFTLKIVIKGE